MVAVSIISPSLNQQLFVQQTLDSIASQGFADYEHIVFDGGSTDGTLEILERAAANDARISLHVGRDSGQANAVNLGLREARGGILTWLNTDDSYVSAAVLSEIVELFDRNPDADVVYGRGQFVAPDGKVLRDTYINHEPERLRYRFINSNGILQPALFFRRGILDRFGYLDESMGCAFDYEYWVRLIAGGAKFAFHDKVLVHAIWHDEMKTSKTRGKSFEESIEVCRRHYGFSPMEWVERLSGYLVAGSDFVMTDKGRDNPKIRQETRQHALEAFRQRNSGAAAKTAILTWAHAPETAKTLAALREASGIEWDRAIVTTFNEPYFEQGLTLIASLHRTATRRTPILVYDLGLTDWQRGHISTLRDVFIVDYPKDKAPAYPEFFDPKSYVYKILAVNHAASIVEPKGTVLFIDAGVAVVDGVDGIFDRIARDGVFFVDHDDKAVWPLRNMTFAPDPCVDGMNATNDELVGLHLCSCLFGYAVGGQFQPLFSEALSYAADPRVALGDKHPPPEAQIKPALGAAANNDRQRAADDRTFRSRLDRGEMRRLFGYLGHRQDQTILSILAARHNAPLSSARAWCISNDASSNASKLNWAARGTSSAVKSSLAAGETFEPSVTIHHRGLYVNLEELDYNVAADRPAVVLGNGPSLKEFDFNRLKPFDVFGMNAAYRYWDEIGWYPKFYSCLDLVVGMSHAEEIARLIRKAPEYGIERFLLRRNLISHIGPIENSDRIVEFDLLRKGTRQFSRLPITTGSHTLIWAAALGYRHIYLMGVDCNYVEIVPGAERREGTALEITAAADENPNYFFAGYQQVGDKYNVPNSSPDLHLGSWRAAAVSLQDFGVTALNANLESKVDAFDFCLFDDVEKGGRVPIIARTKVVGERAFHVTSGPATVPFEPSEAAQIDESALVLGVLGETARKGVMIDVGAHLGGSLKGFAEAGWTIHAFEPDPQNLAKLLQTYGSSPRVIISAEAISGTSGEDVPFFASDESTGISGLTAFHATHRQVARVKTITLNEVVASRGISRLDFLKMDIEGLELPALRALDFSRVSPTAILVEFEDKKTVPQGYDVHDLGQFLTHKGYFVYVSEWHPIERYGVRHSFRRIRKYPCDVPANSWGNLIAFKNDPEPAILKRAIRASTDRRVAFEGETEWEQPEERAMGRRTGQAASTAGSRTAGETRTVAGIVSARLQEGLSLGAANAGRAPNPAVEARAAKGVIHRVRAKSPELGRALRRRPIISAFLAVVGATLLVMLAGRSLLSDISTPELLLALIGANLVLTAIVARIVRKSLISRMTDLAQRTEDTLKRAEARSQHLIKVQFQGLADRIMSEMRMRRETGNPDVRTLAAEPAHPSAGASRPAQPGVGQTEESRAGNLDRPAGAESLVAEQELAGGDIGPASAEIGGTGARPEVNGAANGSSESTIAQPAAAPTLIGTDTESGPGRGSTHQGGSHADRD